MREGDPFSLQTIETGRQNLMHTRYFKDVQMVPTRLADANMMNLDVKVEEQPTGELSGGLGWSTINGFMVDAGITENNFMGRGQIVQIKGSIAQYQRQALFSFTVYRIKTSCGKQFFRICSYFKRKVMLF